MEKFSIESERIETAELGVLERDSFNFELYVEVLEHFDIQAQDWTNPGRDFDAKLISLVQ